MLTRVYCDNFRTLVNFEFKPGKLCLLLGDNGSGKTSFFEALACLSDVVVRGARVGEYYRHSRTAWDKREVQRFELDLQSEPGRFRYSLEIHHPSDGSDPGIAREEVALEGVPLYRFVGGEVQVFSDSGDASSRFSFRPDISYLSAHDPKIGSKLSAFKKLIEGIRLVQLNPFGIEQSTKREQSFLGRWGQNFPSFFYHLNGENPEARARLEEKLQAVIPGFRNFRLETVGDAKQLRAVLKSPSGSDHSLLFGELSEGQRLLAILYSTVFGLAGDSSVLCFDEPDNFVSLPEIQPWLQTLRDALDEHGGQAMVISHHPEVIDYLSLDSAWRFDRPSGVTQVRGIVTDEVADDAGMTLSQVIARGG